MLLTSQVQLALLHRVYLRLRLGKKLWSKLHCCGRWRWGVSVWWRSAPELACVEKFRLRSTRLEPAVRCFTPLPPPHDTSPSPVMVPLYQRYSL